MRSSNFTIPAALMALMLGTGACSLAPKYQQPDMPVAGSFPSVPPVQSAPGKALQPALRSAADLGWRDYFVDPNLQKLISAALTSNRDLREVALTVGAFQAQYRIQRSELFPTITAGGDGVKQRSMVGDNQYATSEAYQVAVGITAYELDLFGRIRNLKDQALEQYLAMEETYRSARLSLVAEVARAYLTWAADAEFLAITEDTVKTEEDSFRLVSQRNSEGLANQLEVAQSRTSLETARSNLAMYQRLVARDINNLTFLIGGPLPVGIKPGSLLSGQMPLSVVPRDLSSKVLLQRPDILSAEHELRGTNANIGAARAAFFPSIRLTANTGFTSSNLSDLFGGGTGTWLFAPSINLPIFTGGRLSAELDVAEIRKDIGITRYERSIQNAFREVADTLSANETYARELTAQQANLEANQLYYTLAKDRYTQGVDSFLTLLDAQRSLYRSRQEYVAIELAELVNRVDLYKALGGGLQERSVPAPKQSKTPPPAQ